MQRSKVSHTGRTNIILILYVHFYIDDELYLRYIKMHHSRRICCYHQLFLLLWCILILSTHSSDMMHFDITNCLQVRNDLTFLDLTVQQIEYLNKKYFLSPFNFDLLSSPWILVLADRIPQQKVFYFTVNFDLLFSLEYWYSKEE